MNPYRFAIRVMNRSRSEYALGPNVDGGFDFTLALAEARKFETVEDAEKWAKSHMPAIQGQIVVAAKCAEAS